MRYLNARSLGIVSTIHNLHKLFNFDSSNRTSIFYLYFKTESNIIGHFVTVSVVYILFRRSGSLGNFKQVI
jgi:hypothetical protein